MITKVRRENTILSTHWISSVNVVQQSCTALCDSCEWEISGNLQEINKVYDKYPVNFNNICLLCYNKGNHSCKYELKNKNKYKIITI